jgi:hypothetical protein
MTKKDESSVLYVRLDAEQKKRFDKLVEDLDLSANKVATMALDDLWAKHNARKAIGVVTQNNDFVARVGGVELSRHPDIAFPELVTIGNRNLQLVDVAQLRQRLFDLDTRLAKAEADRAESHRVAVDLQSDIKDLWEVLRRNGMRGIG